MFRFGKTQRMGGSCTPEGRIWKHRLHETQAGTIWRPAFMGALPMPYNLARERAWASDWLFGAALPLWWERGADQEVGGWHDKLDETGAPLDLPKRLRVQARQAFVYAEAGRLGWDGPWRDACRHGIAFMLDRFKRPDGLYRAAVTREGAPVVEAPDLYDQAFVLFALAAGYAQLGHPAALKAEADALLDQLETRLGHPERGFEEASPRVLPLRSNPQMHLLEALLAWIEVGGGDRYERHARAIVALAREALIDPPTGAIGEYYDGDWAFAEAAGHVREPGHQFEWANLLHISGRILGNDYGLQCARLHRFGTRHGLRDGRVIAETDAVGAPLDGGSRLWAQTEWLRTMLVLAPTMAPAEADAAIAAAGQALATIRRFLDVPLRGLWVDRVSARGLRLDEPAPASSFYHIMTGLAPLIEGQEFDAVPEMQTRRAL